MEEKTMDMISGQTREGMDEYIAFLVDRDRVMQPIEDPNAKDMYGHSLPRCVRCGYCVQDVIGIALFCPACGQRFLDTPNDGFSREREAYASNEVD